jgi:ABC-type nitrate/sulfonate/bicarbonate transport system substrate-binding protein
MNWNNSQAKINLSEVKMAVRNSFFTVAILAALALTQSESFGQTTKLRLGVNAPSTTSAVLLSLARKAGILQRHGLDVDVVYIAGGTLSLQALIGKSLDLLDTGGTPFLLAYLKGAQIKIIGGTTNRLPYTFVARNGIASPQQLKDKKLGISRFGSTDDFAIKLALSEFGLNPKSDVNIVQVGGPPARLSAMKAGAIDGTVLTPALALVARKQGSNVLLDFAARGIEYQLSALIARDEFLRDRPDTVKSFLKAFVEGIRYYKSHKEEAIKKTMELAKVADPEIAAADVRVRAAALPDDGRPTVKGLQLALDDIAETEPGAKSIKINEVVDLSFLP